jgi:DNA repair protein RadD
VKILRTDQNQTIGDVRKTLHESKRVVVQAPTGAGKTVIMADIVSRARDRDKRVIITVPAISLVDQTVIALHEQDIEDIGVIQADHPMKNLSKPVQVASINTLHNYWRKGEMPEADLVLVDEVHRWYMTFPEWMLDPRWMKVPFVGFSASPWTKGLGTLYDRLVTGSSIEYLIEQKVLVPFRTFAPDMPNLSGVRESDGDFVAADLDEVMRPKKLVANILATWKELASDRPTVGFCCSRAHADQLAKEFNGAGIGAGYVDCETPLKEREEVRRRMLAGDVQIVFNVDVIGLGVDWPEISCIVYARPTMSDMRFVQNIGRGLRASPGKEDLLILDHSTTTARLGFVDEIYAYHPKLDDGKTKPKREVVLLPKMCPACHLMKPPRCGTCPHCGHKVEAHIDQVAVERGTLREVKSTDEMADWRKQLPDKPHCFGQLWWYGEKKGYKAGWAAHKVREIFGSFPKAKVPDRDMITEPVIELRNYLWIAKEKWKKEQYNAGRRTARANGNGNGHMNGNGHANGHDKGALTDREQAIIDRVAEQAKASLMTDDDWNDMGDFR